MALFLVKPFFLELVQCCSPRLWQFRRHLAQYNSMASEGYNPDFDANNPHIGLVHRTDKDTSGLLLIAKNEDAKAKLGLQFFNKTT